MKLKFILIFLLWTTFGYAGDFFKDGSRICFIGNSITHSGDFHHNILLFHVTRFPHLPLTFFNCGISGDVTGGVLDRMEDDILVNQPSHAVIMIGMNDVQRSLYREKPVSDADTLRRRDEAIRLCNTNLEKIINKLLEKNVRVILQTPSIYDQTAVIDASNNLGVNDALKQCADFVGLMAAKYNLPVVDYWTLMNKINLKLQKREPTATLVGPDRVHPGAPGHLIMAYQFLKTENVSPYVSKIVIGKSKEESALKSRNAEILSQTQSREGFEFTVNEGSLPFPVVENQEKGVGLVPFINELNREILCVGAPGKGEYRLSIDGIPAGTFSARQLRKGINLAEFHNTPQYLQAVRVRDVLLRLWMEEAKIRGIKLIERSKNFKNCPEKENPALVKSCMEKVVTHPYILKILKDYVVNKPIQEDLEREQDRLRQEAYEAARPVVHKFSVTRIH